MKKIILLFALAFCLNYAFSQCPVSAYKSSAPISLTGISGATISGDSILAGSGPAISLTNCRNITITRCKLSNGNNITAVGVYLYNCTNITIDTCFFTNVATGVEASTSTGVNIHDNQFLNMMGPYPRGQFVQFVSISGAGNRIANNKCQNILKQSTPEDAINLYQSSGTAASPITISGNWIMGGGPSTTGGGICLGDNAAGSAYEPAYQVAENNILVNPGQYGIGVAGGSNIQVLNNQVFAAENTFTNVGIIVWNQYASGCSLITVSGNQVNWTNSKGALNPNYNPGNCGTVGGWANNTWNAPITSAILPTVIITDK